MHLANTSGNAHPRGRKMAFRRDAFSDPMMEAPLRRIKAPPPPTPPSRDHLFLYTPVQDPDDKALLELCTPSPIYKPGFGIAKANDGCRSIRGKSDLENFALAC
ncbi:unnamed protein product [Lasius platythorax]|uniref:Uncharacterized protein n=1 Tax=Lasius platythorax TaxID=488582 RepID=A0AAV2NEZ3_9HYME